MTSAFSPPLAISIIGGCQVSGLAAAARALLPAARVAAWHVGVDEASSVDRVSQALGGSDLVLSQFDETDARVSLRPSAMRAQGLKTVLIPTLVFPGFHPDMIYVPLGNGSLLLCQGGEYHSRITAAAFRLGLPREQVLRLFNAYVFAALRYFDIFDAASVLLVNAFEKYDYDLRPLIPRWTAQSGAFMHTINHPKILVLADLCTLALKKAGLIEGSALVATPLKDNLESNFVGAVFPPLARRLGIEGSTSYQRAISTTPPGQQRTVSLREHIAGSYAEYQHLPPDFAWGAEVEAASTVLRGIVVVPPSRPHRSFQSLLDAARAASSTSDTNEGVLRWGEMIRLQPDLVEAHIKLGNGLRDLGDWARCEAVCSQAWLRFPNNMWVGRNWALSAQYAGDLAEAIRRYTQVHKLHHNDLIAADLADCLLISGDLESAHTILEDALHHFADSQWLHATMQRLAPRMSGTVV